MITDLRLTARTKYLYTISDPTEWFPACKEPEFDFRASGLKIARSTACERMSGQRLFGLLGGRFSDWA